jgi:hypothetical protein
MSSFTALSPMIMSKPGNNMQREKYDEVLELMVRLRPLKNMQVELETEQYTVGFVEFIIVEHTVVFCKLRHTPNKRLSNRSFCDILLVYIKIK